jgi:hypothetical protein
VRLSGAGAGAAVVTVAWRAAEAIRIVGGTGALPRRGPAAQHAWSLAAGMLIPAAADPELRTVRVVV